MLLLGMVERGKVTLVGDFKYPIPLILIIVVMQITAIGFRKKFSAKKSFLLSYLVSLSVACVSFLFLPKEFVFEAKTLLICLILSGSAWLILKFRKKQGRKHEKQV
jgi:hypothetical protein